MENTYKENYDTPQSVISNVVDAEELTLEPTGDIAAAIFAGKKCAGVKIVDIQGTPHAVVPQGVILENMARLLPNPLRISNSVGFEEPDSFCAYVEEFREAYSRLYGFPDEYAIAAVFDDNDRVTPRWREHKALLQLKPSAEWGEWINAFKTTFSQMELADFLNDHMEQIAQPDASELVSGVSTINIANNWKCTSVQHEGGDIAFSYAKENSAQTASGKIPTRLTLYIAPFRSWHPISMTVYLSYRLNGEKLTFTMRGHQVKELLAASFDNVRTHVQEALKATVLI